MTASRILGYSLLVSALATTACSSDGPSDSGGFAGSAYVFTEFPGSTESVAKAVACQSDGKIIVVGADGLNGFGMARYQANGTLDSHFGTAAGAMGVPPMPSGSSSRLGATAVAVDANGKILVAGATESTYSVLRMNPNGTPDSTFGQAGWVTIAWVRSDPITSNELSAMTATADAIFLGGNCYYGAPSSFGVCIVELDGNGALVTTFGNGGVASFPAGASTLINLTVFENGTIRFDANGPNGGPEAFNLDANGAVLSTMDMLSDRPTGATTLVSANTTATSPAGDRVYLGGSTSLPSGVVNLIAAHHLNAAIDTSFNATGYVTWPGVTGDIRRLLMQPDGKIIAAGFVSGTASSPGNKIEIVRVNSDGTMDPSFGTNGSELYSPFENNYTSVLGATLQSDGKIVVVGAISDHSTTGTAKIGFMLARFLPSGAPDTGSN